MTTIRQSLECGRDRSPHQYSPPRAAPVRRARTAYPRGEQFALPEAIAPLRGQRDAKVERGRRICVDATDPLNLVGVILPGSRVPATLGNRLVLDGGEVVATREAGVIRHIVPQEPTEAWEVDTLLTRTVGGEPRLRRA